MGRKTDLMGMQDECSPTYLEEGDTWFAPTRRDFIHGAVCLAATAGLFGAATASLSGCDGTDGGKKNLPVSFTPGTYTGIGTGKHGDIQVKVTFERDMIDSVEVLSQTETADLSDVALKVVPLAIVANQSLAVDTVSGATLSSLGVIAAVADAALQAGCDPSALKNAPATYEPTQTMTAGTYTATAYGRWKKGSIEGARHGAPAVIKPTEVAITVDETSILSVTVSSCSDTPGFMEPALDRTPKSIVEQQSLYVDTVTGATMTAAAITAATMGCLEQAGADLAGFAKKTPKSDGEETYNCDLCIIGAGLTGTAAALEATEKGLNVILIEKTNRVSGTGACSTGPFAVGAQMDLKAGITMSVEEAFESRKNEDEGRTNASLVYKIIENTGHMVDWLQERWTSIGDAGFNITKSSDPMNLMHVYGKGTKKFKDLYDSYIVPKGGKVLFETQLSGVEKSDDGKVKAVTALKQDGTKVTVNCRAALVCTGGFGGNAAMMKTKLNGVFDLIGLASNIGDGIETCQNMGFRLSDDISPALAEFCGNDVIDYYDGYMKFINQLGFLMLDPAGARFMNEEWCLTESNGIGAAAMRRASWSWVILTQTDLDSLQEKGVWGHLTKEYCKQYEMRSRIIDPIYTTIKDEMDQCIKYGQAYKTDTLDALGKAVGFDTDTYKQALDGYKQAIANKADTLFGKDPRLLYLLDNGPFYAVRIISPIDNTYNGIRIDTSFQALDENLQPSCPGLYIAGMDSGGYFTYPYTNFLGASSSYCLTSGMLAADSIRAYLKA